MDCFVITVTLKIMFLKMDISLRKTQIMTGKVSGPTSYSYESCCEPCVFHL